MPRKTRGLGEQSYIQFPSGYHAFAGFPMLSGRYWTSCAVASFIVLKGRNGLTTITIMKPKLKCPNCGEFKIHKVSAARYCLYLFCFCNGFAFGCPIIGWIFIIPMLVFDIFLVPVTIIAYCSPKLRHLTAKCFKCRWEGELNEIKEAS